MKFNFKIQQYQTDAVDAVVKVFNGQGFHDKISYISHRCAYCDDFDQYNGGERTIMLSILLQRGNFQILNMFMTIYYMHVHTATSQSRINGLAAAHRRL